MKNWIDTRELILKAPLPQHGESYGIIPNELFINSILECIDVNNYTLFEERYLTNAKNTKVTGYFVIHSNKDIELAPTIYFVNSYDKSLKANIRIGGTVLVCSNGMMSSRVYSRKHLGDNAYTDFKKMISVGLQNLENDFNTLLINKEEMKNIEIDKKVINSLVSDMFLNEELIKTTQLDILKKELKFSKNFKDSSLWSFYNNVTESFKDNNPHNHNKQHGKFHGYISDNFDLTNAPGVFKKAI